MKHRGCKLVVSAVLALAVLCFSPPAFGADSASLASLGPSVGNSQSTGGGFERLMDMPETIRKTYYSRFLGRNLSILCQKSDKIGLINDIPVRAYFTTSYSKKVGGGSVQFNKYTWFDADGVERGSFAEAVDGTQERADEDGWQP